MSVGPMGVAGSIAGGLPQIRSAEQGQSEKLSTDQARRAKSEQSAEAAAGIGETTQDEKTSDRDADGRRMWEQTPEHGSNSENTSDNQDSEDANVREASVGKDPTGDSGGLLDLSG